MRTLLLNFLSVLVVGGLEFRAQAAAAPVVTTAAATGLSNSVATLNGTVNPGGAETTAWFEWGLYPVNNTNLTVPVAVGSGSVPVGLSTPLGFLTPGVNYHGRLVASNAFGIVRGLGVRFGSPALTLNGASNMSIGYQGTFSDLGATATGAPLAIAGGKYHNLAVKGDGTVSAWGRNSSRQTAVPVGLSNVVAVAGGQFFSLALKKDGTVAAWGGIDLGETNIPMGLSNVMAIAAGYFHSLALKSDGTVVAWGGNSDGQTNIPVGLSGVVAIAAGDYHSLALKSDGTVAAWGGNTYYGQADVPVGLSNVVAIAGGCYHSVALKSDGTVVVWGDNSQGQKSIPAGLSNVVAIAAGDYHSLASKNDGTVAAWGYDAGGQSTVPLGLSRVVAVSAGNEHSLALKSDGTAVAWGGSYYGQTNVPVGLASLDVTVGGSVEVDTPGIYTLTYTSSNSLGGVATPVARTVVVARPPPTAVTLVASGQSNTVATLNGTVNPNGSATTAWFEWGLYPVNNTNLTAPVSVGGGLVPVELWAALSGLVPGVNYHVRMVASNEFGVVRGLDVAFGSPALTLNGAANVRIGYRTTFVDPGAAAVAAPLGIAGGANHSLILKNDGALLVWGTNILGQTKIPVGLNNTVAVAAGYAHSLALKRDGTVVGWGYNNYNQTNIPVGLTDVVAVAAGYYQSLAMKRDGTVIAWGANYDGQTNVPAGLRNMVAVVGGFGHWLALRSDGTMTAWGRNTSGQTNIPVGLSNVVAIAGGAEHGLALRRDGTVAAWGRNTSGQTNIPSGLSNVVAIAGGANHNLALKRDGVIVAWGANGDGQTNVPVGLSNVVAFTAGANHNLALKSDGSVVAWGWNGEGQTTIPVGLSNVPVTVDGSVDSNTPGTYILTYSSTNVLGGVATPVIRTVVVGPPPTRPLLTGVTRLGNGTFQFSFTNTPGTSFTLFASTNVALPFGSWLNLGTAIENPAGFYQFIDLSATNSPQRFYGVRSP